MRPRGEIRLALAEAVQRLVEPGGGANYRAIAEAAQVGYDAAQETLRNMARAGELAVVCHMGGEGGTEVLAGSGDAGAAAVPAAADAPPAEALPQRLRGFPQPVDA